MFYKKIEKPGICLLEVRYGDARGPKDSPVLSARTLINLTGAGSTESRADTDVHSGEASPLRETGTLSQPALPHPKYAHASKLLLYWNWTAYT